jgi:hypothetical protein
MSETATVLEYIFILPKLKHQILREMRIFVEENEKRDGYIIFKLTHKALQKEMVFLKHEMVGYRRRYIQ